MEHLTDYVKREAVFGGRVLPILVIDRDCRMFVDCPLYFPWEWIPKMISVSPPSQREFGSQDVLDALEEIAVENDRVKKWVTCGLVKISGHAKYEEPKSGKVSIPILRRFFNHVMRLMKERQTDNPYHLNGKHPVPCRYFDEPVVIIPYQHGGEVITFDAYKALESCEKKASANKTLGRLPLEFLAPLHAVERYLQNRGAHGFDIVNLESLAVF